MYLTVILIRLKLTNQFQKCTFKLILEYKSFSTRTQVTANLHHKCKRLDFKPIKFKLISISRGNILICLQFSSTLKTGLSHGPIPPKNRGPRQTRSWSCLGVAAASTPTTASISWPEALKRPRTSRPRRCFVAEAVGLFRQCRSGQCWATLSAFRWLRGGRRCSMYSLQQRKRHYPTALDLKKSTKINEGRIPKVWVIR